MKKEQTLTDLKAFAGRYAKAWCSQNPEAVAAFYADVALGFMSAFPDMEVTMDDLVPKSHEPYETAFHWTLTGTNTGPGGTAKRVRISGVELWQLDEDGLIRDSKGHFDVAEYERQVMHGVDD